MSLSLAIEYPFTCPYCQQHFQKQVWQVVSVSEDKDLRERLRQNILHSVICPRCNEFITGLDVPFLLLQQDRKPELLFFPSPGRNREEVQLQLGRLLQTWKESSGGEKNNHVFRLVKGHFSSSNRVRFQQGNIEIGTRNSLLYYLDGQDAEFSSLDLEKSIDLLRDLVSLESPYLQFRLIKRYPQLLDPRIDNLLHDIKSHAITRGESELSEALEQTYLLLLKCRYFGLEEVFVTSLGIPTEERLLMASGYGMPWNLFVSIMQTSVHKASTKSELKECMDLYEAGLEFIAQDQNPLLWATLNNLLGIALTRYPERKEENIPRAIEHYERALRVFHQGTDPNSWALIQNNLGNAYQDKMTGIIEENINQALGHFHAALEVLDPEKDRDTWAMVNLNLGNLYARQIDRQSSHQTDFFKQAIEHWEAASLVYTRENDPEEWMRMRLRIASAYLERLDGDRTQNIEKAILMLVGVKNVAKNDSQLKPWLARSNHLLGKAYLERRLGNPITNRRSAIQYLEEASEILDPREYPEDASAIQNSLGLAWLESFRIDRKYFSKAKSLENIKKALRHFKLALETMSLQDDPLGWADVQNNMGVVLSKVFESDQVELEEKASSLKKAIIHLKAALDIYEPIRSTYAYDWAQVQHNLGSAYFNLVELGQHQHLGAAIHHYQNALEELSSKAAPFEYLKTTRSLGHLLFYRNEWNLAADYLKKATLVSQYMFGQAVAEQNKLVAAQETSFLFDELAYCYLKLGRYVEALLTLEEGRSRLFIDKLNISEFEFSVNEGMEQEVISAIAKISELENEIRSVPITTIEGAALTEEIQYHWQTITEKAMFHKSEISVEELFDLLPEESALIAPIFTQLGTAVILLFAGQNELTQECVVWLDELKAHDIHRVIFGTRDKAGWLYSYRDLRPNLMSIVNELNSPTGHEMGSSLWPEFDEMLEDVWLGLMRPVFDRLQKLPKSPVKHILIMPDDGLGLLPIHATGPYIEKEIIPLIEQHAFTLVPSLRLYKVCRNRLMDNQEELSILIAANATMDLPYAEIEGRILSNSVTTKNLLMLGRMVDKETLLTTSCDFTYLHLACHGEYDWLFPTRSGLQLADHEYLTMADVLATPHFHKCRLVVLSSCESGISEHTETPNEFYGFAISFIASGATGVISSLWAVNDISTSLLMDSFYRLHLNEGFHPAVALRKAQVWLRNVTAAELEARYVVDGGETLGLTTKDLSDNRRRFGTMAPDSTPFNHPYFWAGFLFSGA